MKDKITINASFNSRGYISTKNDDYNLRFKENSKVDLSFTPEGLSFSPYPVSSMAVAKRMHLDPRFIMKHKISGTTLLCFFLLEESTISQQTIKALKKEISYDERRKKDTSVFSDLSTTDDSDEEITFDPPGSQNTEAEALDHLEQEDIMDQLHQMDLLNLRYNKLHPTAIQKTTCHVEIYVRFFIRRDSVTEISKDLNMSQSTVSRSISRIADIIKQYREE